MNIKLIKEENNNYGHTNLIFKGDVNFPNLSHEYFDEITDIKQFNKRKEVRKAIKKGLHKVNQDDYYKIYRIGVNEFNKPNDLDGPTLTLSLFLPNKYFKYDLFSLKDWIQKYYINQVYNILIFNYYFPNGNFRSYLDHYLIEKLKKEPDNGDFNITKIDYNDYNYKEGIKVKKFLDTFYNMVKEYDNYNFNNSAERFLFFYNLASKCYNNNGSLEIKKKTGDFFIYKFIGPFIENLDKPEEGHITDGFFGQLARLIILRQDKYKYKDKIINRAKHIVFRDSHTTMTCYNDYIFIKKLNEISKKNIEVNFLPFIFDYRAKWHDHIKNDIDNLYYKQSFPAGKFQIINNKLFKNDKLYLETIGMGFLLNIKNELVIKKHRPIPHPTKLITNEYNYGIDEYLLSSFLVSDKIKNKTILIKSNFQYGTLFEFYNKYYNSIRDYTYYMCISQILLICYLKNKKIISNLEKKGKIFQEIENLRSKQNIDEDKILSYLLAIFPNKYNLNNCMFYKNDDTVDFFDQLLNIKLIIKKFSKNNKKVKKMINKIDYETLNYFGLNCEENEDIETVLLTYQYPNLKRDFDKKHSIDFFSGYYGDNPESLKIGIIREPDDLEKVKLNY